MLSIVVPVFNESTTIGLVIARLRALPFSCQIIIVDDGSTDGTGDYLQSLAGAPGIDVLTHPMNRGKGAAVRTGMASARGDVVIIQDADLEYDPADISALIRPIIGGESHVVFGSRFLGHREGMRRSHAVGNRVLTTLCNLLFRVRLTDLETGYKALSAEAASSIRLRSQRWGIDPEITARLLKAGYSIREVPISYAGRSVDEGKKIRRRDSLVIAATLLRYRFLD